MARQPIAGAVAGIVGLVSAAVGVALAAWAAMAATDRAQGYEWATWALEQPWVDIPWDAERVATYALEHVWIVAIAAFIALATAWARLRQARIALRPASESQDGRGELKVAGMQEPRVGRPFEGSIVLREAPMPGEEFDVILTAWSGGRAAHRFESKSRARPGAHGVTLPFRFDVPATAPPSGVGTRWRLEFAPVGKRFGRSWCDVTLGPASEGARAMVASRPVQTVREQPAPSPPAQPRPAMLQDTPDASTPEQAYLEHIEKLAGAFGKKLTERQREMLRGKLREKLAGPQAAAIRPQLDAMLKLTPEYAKWIKYGLIGVIILYVVVPIVLSVVGGIMAAVFGR